MKNRIVQPHVVAKRLSNLGSTHPLSKALTHLGRLVKTTYLFRYMSDRELRRAVRQMLNRGEGRHQLVDHIFFGNQGRFRSGDYFEMMNKSSCLSLISNAVLVWNTWHMGKILEKAECDVNAFLPEELAHVHPLMFRHLTVNGTYDFSGQSNRATLS